MIFPKVKSEVGKLFPAKVNGPRVVSSGGKVEPKSKLDPFRSASSASASDAPILLTATFYAYMIVKLNQGR